MSKLDDALERAADAFANRLAKKITDEGLAQYVKPGSSIRPPEQQAPSVPSILGSRPERDLSGGGLDLGPLNGLGSVGMAALRGAGQGIASTPAGALGSPGVLAQNMGIGAVGGLIDSTVGNVPVIGDMISAQFHAFENAVRQPAQAATRGVGRQIGDLAALGYDVSDREIMRMGERALSVERARFTAQRRVERRVEELNAQNGVSFGLSSLGL